MFTRPRPKRRLTKTDKLFSILEDGEWHPTQELVRRVGHTFPGFIYRLRRSGYTIKRQKHPTKKYQHQYRLTDEPPF